MNIEIVRKHAKHLMERLQFACFLETSAKNGHQVEAVFEKAVSLVSSVHY